MSWFSGLLKKAEEAEQSDPRLVKQIQSGYVYTQFHPDTPKDIVNEQEEELTFYLYEDQFGNRKFDAVDSRKGDINIKTAAKNEWLFRCETYRHTVRPWLDGRANPDIPTYESVPRRDFKKVLEG